MRGCNLAHHSQTQSRTGGMTRDERFEYFFTIVLRHTRAVVVHFETQEVASPRCLYRHAAVGRRMTYRVQHEVIKRACELHGIENGVLGRRCRCLRHGKRDLRMCRRFLMQRDSIVEPRPKRDVHIVDANRLSERQQAHKLLLHPMNLLEDRRERPLLAIFIADESVFCFEPHCADWIADLVRNLRSKPAECGEALRLREASAQRCRL